MAGDIKQIGQLEEGLRKNLSLDFFDEWEIESVLDEINYFGPYFRQKILSLCYALSGASSSIVPNALKKIREASLRLSSMELDSWISNAFDLLDSRGIDPFLKFIASVDMDSLRQYRGTRGLRLKDISSRLETYLRGLAGADFRIGEAEEPYTDTLTVYLPPALDIFDTDEKNFLLYKIMAVHKWAQIAGGTLAPDKAFLKQVLPAEDYERLNIENLFDFFPLSDLASDLYNVLEAFRLEGFQELEVPGLVKETGAVKAFLFDQRPDLEVLSRKTAFVEGLYQLFLAGRTKGRANSSLEAVYHEINKIKDARGPNESIKLLLRAYDEAKCLSGSYTGLTDPLIIGRIRPEKVSGRLKAEREAKKRRLEGIITGLMRMADDLPSNPHHTGSAPSERIPRAEGDYLLIKGKLIELDSEMKEIVGEMAEPAGLLVKGRDIGSARRSILLKDDFMAEEADEIAGSQGGIKYDEWDYRRGGYKKNWCSLYEQDLHHGSEPFVELTLKRYGGYISTLRKKFELFKREPKMLRRQREGDDIDINAAVEAFTDLRAGLSPNDDWFTRHDRQERSIAVLFLLDMSGSTKGWVNEAEKEALVLMCEALETLGDSYAIFGFSGLTRSRCDFYKIKEFKEAYSDAVRERIAGIIPKDYTRMGPPIRHSINILSSAEARTRLLIILSDGKPEDWDAYKGDYGIEDTRKALLEARERRIQSFCITIDKQAGSYLPHMFGEAKYIVIDDIRTLPNRITEIYRVLTV